MCLDLCHAILFCHNARDDTGKPRLYGSLLPTPSKVHVFEDKACGRRVAVLMEVGEAALVPADCYTPLEVDKARQKDSVTLGVTILQVR